MLLVMTVLLRLDAAAVRSSLGSRSRAAADDHYHGARAPRLHCSYDGDRLDVVGHRCHSRLSSDEQVQSCVSVWENS